jgi:hypothetical protein
MKGDVGERSLELGSNARKSEVASHFSPAPRTFSGQHPRKNCFVAILEAHKYISLCQICLPFADDAHEDERVIAPPPPRALI